MSVVDKLNEKLAELNVTASELPAKTQRKIESMKKIIESKLPTYRDKQGNFTEKTKEKIADLIDDIIAEAEVYAEERDEKNKPTDPPAADPKPNDPPAPAPDPQPKKKSFFDLF